MPVARSNSCFWLFSCLFATAFSLCSGSAEDLSADEMLFFGTGVIEKSAIKTVAPPTPVAPTADNTGLELKRRQVELKVILLDNPKKSFATANLATFSATASTNGTANQPQCNYPQGGTVFSNAMLYGIVSLQKKISAWPAGLTVDYRCPESYLPHEQDSAAVAAAVLLHSIVTGQELNPKVVLIGGIGPETTGGAVTSAVAIGTRLRNLPDDTPLRIGVPLVSEPDVRDLALMGEPELLLRHEVFALVTLDDAISVAAANPPENFAKASAIFDKIRAANATTPLPALLKSPQAQAKLSEILQLVPQHLSARLLLLTATGKLSGKMTFVTSQQAVLKAAKPFWETIEKGDRAAIQRTSITSGNILNLMQAKVHPSVERYLIATRAYMRACNNLLDILPGPQYELMRQKALRDTEKVREDIKIEKAKLEAAVK